MNSLEQLREACAKWHDDEVSKLRAGMDSGVLPSFGLVIVGIHLQSAAAIRAIDLTQFERGDKQEIEWIPVTSRRPERNQTVVYWDISAVQHGGRGFPAIADEWRDEQYLHVASHWMPMHEPPIDLAKQEEK